MILDGRDTRPWIRWWWLGSALTPNEIARQLEQLRGAGFGGVEIQPIYAASPPWCPSVDYLSPVWVELLVHTLREAGRLGLGVDLTTGSGWPWGGPGLETQHAAWKLVIRTTQAPETVVDIPAVIQGEPGCVVAVTASLEGATAGEPAHVIRPDWPGREGRFHARLGPGVWSLTVARQVPTGQQVKRASPGAEGPVVDHFSRQAVGAFLRRFDPLLRSLGTQLPRAAFTDSYEVYGADWTPRLPEAFRSARGYDLEPWLRYLDPGATDGLCRRVVHDYRQTLRELQIQALDVWIDWCREHGMRSRLQAHGSPGQLLDLYARADIPETEGFGKEGVVERFGRFASSAAHLAGRVLCSAEAFTWLDDHFRTGPDHMRQEADRYFLCGINHLVFHGAPTTPEGMPFPGQLFYAGIDVSEHMPWFQDLGPLCAYIGRAQAALRWGRPDPDVLLFHPIHDVLFAPPEAGQKDNWGYLTTCGAHNTQSWLDAEVKPFAETDRALEAAGYVVDFVSDAQIRSLTWRDGRIHSAGASYGALAFAGPCRAEPETLRAAAALAAQGACVWVVGPPPRAHLETTDPREAEPTSTREQTALAERARGVSGPEALVAALGQAGVRNEVLEGFRFTRRTDGECTLYFLKRTGGEYDGEVTLAFCGGRARIEDPVTGSTHVTAAREVESGSEVHLTVEAGGTRIVVLEPGSPAVRSRPPEPPRQRGSHRILVPGPWSLSWVDYTGQTRQVRLDTLTSWPQVPDLGLFSGVVVYETGFVVPRGATDPALAWTMDLGDLYVTAAVSVNDTPVGTAWTRPYRLILPPGLLRENNTLRVRVANLAANRVIGMERAGASWRRFHFMGASGPFDASGWSPLPSGLLGPVTLRVC